MRRCPFSPYLSIYQGDPGVLQAHLRRCESCAFTEALLHSLDLAAPDANARSCPDSLQLADYATGALTDSDAESVRRHLAGCHSCQEKVQPDEDVNPVDEATLLAQADLRIDAYDIGRDLALHLCAGHFPQHQQTVAIAFDTAFEASQERPRARQHISEEVLAFVPSSSGGPDRAIVGLALIVADFISGTEKVQQDLVAQLQENRLGLEASGISGRLFDAALLFLSKVGPRQG